MKTHEHTHDIEHHPPHHGHDAQGAEDRAAATGDAAGHATHDGHGGHGKHAGHHVEMFRRRFWVSLLLSVPVVLTSHMVMDWFGYELDFYGMEWVGPVLGSVIFFWGGWPFLEGGWREAKERQPGMMLLIAMAITVAYVASVATSLDAFDLDFWWELSLLVTIMLLGHWQEMKALGQAQDALAALAALLPDEAERCRPDGQVETVALDELRVGDVVLVRSGARVPADGEIVEGSAELDESMITGESKPVAKDVGDRVVAGTVSTDSAIRVRVDAVGDDTALAGIQRLVSEAQESRSRAQVLADRAAALLFYVATGAAVITGIVWLALGETDEAVTRVVTVLVISCPHALGLAIPLTTSISSAMAATNGILVKDRLALEESRTVQAFLFDKTGTLTKGQHTVVGVAGAGGVSEDEVLRLAGGVESDSEHPLARAIVAAARDRGEVAAATGFRSITGRGVEATVDGQAFAVGGPALLRERYLTEPAELADWVQQWKGRGAAVLYLVRGDTIVGAIALEDEVRPEARDAVDQLQAMGRRVVMITGDARQVADAVGRDLGVDEVFAEVLPEDKANKVAELQARGLEGRHGRRRRQRRPRPGDRGCRHRHRCGHRRRDRVGRPDLGQLRPSAGRQHHPALGGRVPQEPPEPLVGRRVQHPGHPDRRRRPACGRASRMPPAVAAILMSASTIVVATNAQLLRRVNLRPETVSDQPQPVEPQAVHA